MWSTREKVKIKQRILNIVGDFSKYKSKNFSDSVLRLQTYFEGAAASLYLSRVP